MVIAIDGDRADGTSYVVVVRGDSDLTVQLAGRYTDEVRRTFDGRWRFARRTLDSQPAAPWSQAVPVTPAAGP